MLLSARNNRLNRGVVCLLVAGMLLASSSAAASSALEKYRALIEKDPVDGQLFVRMCRLAEKEGAVPALVEEYRARAQGDQGDVVAALLTGHLAAYMGDAPGAFAWYERACRRAPGSWHANYHYARSLAGRDDDRAAELLKRARPLARSARHRRMHVLLMSRVARARGDLEGVREAVQALVDLEGGDVFARLEAARLYEGAGLLEDAVRENEAIVALSQDNQQRRAKGLLALADLHDRLGRFDAAADALEETLSLLAPDNALRAKVVSRRADLYRTHGRIADLLSLYRTHLEARPLDAAGRLDFVRLLRQEGRLDEALAQYEKLLTAWRHDVGVIREAGALAARADDSARLARFADMFRDASPRGTGDWVRLAQWYGKLGRDDDARACLAEARRAVAADPRALLELGRECGRVGFSAEARTIFEEIARRRELDGTLLVALAEAQCESGDREGAVATLGHVLARSPESLGDVLAVARAARACGLSRESVRAYRMIPHLVADQWEVLRETARNLAEDEGGDVALACWWRIARQAASPGLCNEAEDEIVNVFRRRRDLEGLRTQCEALARESGDPAASVILGKLLVQEGLAEQAAEHFAGLRKARPDDVRVAVFLEKAYDACRRYDDALSISLELTRMDPVHRMQHYRRAIDHAFLGREREQVVALVDRMVAGSPDNPEARLLARNAFERMGDARRALSEARQATRLSGGDPRYIEGFAALLERHDAPVEAAALYERIFRETDDGAVALSVARHLIRLGVLNDRLDRVESLFERKRRDRADALSWYQPLVWLYEERGEEQRIVALYEEALRSVTDRSVVLGLLAEHADMLAARDVAGGVARGHSNAPDLDPQEALDLATFLMAAGQPAEARRVIERAAGASAADRHELLLAAAAMFSRRDRPGDAVALVREAAKGAGASMPLQAASAYLYERVGDFDDAAARYLALARQVSTPEGAARYRQQRAAALKASPRGGSDALRGLGVPSDTDDTQLEKRFVDAFVRTASRAGSLRERSTRLATELEPLATQADFRLMEAVRTALPGEDESLLDLYRKAVDVFPEDLEWRGKLVHLARRMGRTDAALAAFAEPSKGRSRRGVDARSLNDVLEVLITSGDEKKLDRFLDVNRGRSDVYMGLFSKFQDKAMPSRAADVLLKAAEHDSGFKYQQGEALLTVLMDAGRRDEALAFLKEALRFVRDEPTAVLNAQLQRMRRLLRMVAPKLTDDERRAFAREQLAAPEAAGGRPADRMVVAALAEFGGETDRAVREYVAAALAQPHDIYLHKAVISVLRELGRSEAFAPVVDKYLAEEREPPRRKNFCRALVAALGGRRLPEATMNVVEQALLAPMSGTLVPSDALQLADYYQSVGQVTDALRVLRQAAGQPEGTARHHQATVLRRLLLLLVRQGARDEAVETAVRLIRTQPGVSRGQTGYGPRVGALAGILELTRTSPPAVTDALQQAVRRRLAANGLSDEERLDLAILAGHLGMEKDALYLLGVLSPLMRTDDALQLAYFDALLDARHTRPAIRLGERLLRRRSSQSGDVLAKLADLYVSRSDTYALKRLYALASRTSHASEDFKTLSAAMLSAGMADEAIDAFRRYVRLSKGATSSADWSFDVPLAALERRLGRREDAVATIGRAVRAFESAASGAAFPRELYAEMVACHGAAGSLDGLVQRYEEQTARDLQDQNALNVLGMLCAEVGRYETAVEARRRLAALDPDSERRQVELAAALCVAGQRKEAAQVYRKAAENATRRDAARYLTDAAGCLIEANEIDRACAVLQEALGVTAKSPQLLPGVALDVSRSYEKAGMPERRRDVLRRAFEAGGRTNLSITLEWINLLLARGDVSRAGEAAAATVDCWRREDQYRDLAEPFLASKALDPPGHDALGDALLQERVFAANPAGVAYIIRDIAQETANRGHVDGADALLVRLTALTGLESATLFMRARLAAAAGRGEDASRLYEQLASHDPDLAQEALLELAQMHLRAGRTDVGKETLDRACALADGPRVRSEAARQLARAGATDEAIQAYRSLLERWPADDAALTDVVDLLLAGGRQDDAVALLREARANRSEVETLTLIAHLFERLRDPGEAADTFLLVLENDPKNTNAFERLLSIRRGQGRWDEVARLLEGAPGAGEGDLDRRVDLYVETGRLEALVTSTGEAVAREEKALAETALELARSMEEVGRLSGAIDYYRRALVFREHVDEDKIRSKLAELAARLERGDI